MSAFDAPSREACVVRRGRTNTPLQALLLMNDPQYVEAARFLAQRILTEAEPSPEKRIRWVFEQVTSRSPSERESAVIVAAYREHLAEYASNPELAKALTALGETPADERLKPAELAAWTMVANLLLNLDEVVTKR